MNTNESSWKPSDGQLECLEYAINNAEKDYSPLAGNRIYLTLKALKKQLEKIKNENIVMEDYKEKYNKLVEAIKALQEANPSNKGIQNWINTKVPELAESEDEKIRKDLISLLNSSIDGKKVFSINSTTREQMIAWLEKSKPTAIDIDKKHLKLEKGKWYLCIKDFQWKPDFTDCHQGEKYYCSREGVVQNFYFQHPEKYFCEYQNNAKDEIVHFIPEGYFAEIRNDAVVIKKEKPIKIKKRHLTGKAADLAKEVTPESLEEAKEKLNAEEKLNKRLNKEIEDWFESGPPSSLPWCTVKDATELTARHFFELGLKAREDKQ